MHGELDVRAARLHPDLPNAGNCGVAHALVFAVGEGLRRGDGDGIPRMHAHGIEVLYRADDDHVVLSVAHHLKLVLFPARDGLLDEDLGDHARLEAAAGHVDESHRVGHNGAAGPAEGERGPDDEREPDGLGDGARLLQVVGESAAGKIDPDPLHGFLEQLAVLCLADGIAVRADHLHPAAVQDALFRELDGDVETGLAPEGGKKRVGALRLDDLFQHGDGDRLDVGGIGHLGVRHDRGGIGVDQDDPEALFPQRLAGLGAGVIELAGLADDDRPGPDDQDGGDVGSLRHQGVPSIMAANLAKWYPDSWGPGHASGWYWTLKRRRSLFSRPSAVPS